RVGRGDPAQLVDLVVGREAVVRGHVHQPVADDLVPALAVGVAGGRELAAERAAQAGLLVDLAHRALLPALARVELALGQRPVVIARPVDQRDPPAAPHDAAGRLYP